MSKINMYAPLALLALTSLAAAAEASKVCVDRPRDKVRLCVGDVVQFDDSQSYRPLGSTETMHSSIGKIVDLNPEKFSPADLANPALRHEVVVETLDYSSHYSASLSSFERTLQMDDLGPVFPFVEEGGKRIEIGQWARLYPEYGSISAVGLIGQIFKDPRDGKYVARILKVGRPANDVLELIRRNPLMTSRYSSVHLPIKDVVVVPAPTP